MVLAIRLDETSPTWGRSVGFRGFDSPRSFAGDLADVVSDTPEVFSPSSGWVRSECWEALQQQVRSAQATQSFVFSHRRLDGAGAAALGRYLQEDCAARFVDISFLKRWPKVTEAAAAALSQGLRRLRSLSVDGNDLAQNSEIFERWCSAVEAHPGLQHLSLQKTGLGDHEAKRLAEVLRNHSLLFSLDLGCNPITDQGASAILSAMDDNHILLEMALEGTAISETMRQQLAAAVERNQQRYHGARPVAEVLRGLRRAAAEAATSQAQLDTVLDEVESRAPTSPTSATSSPRKRRGASAPTTPAAASDLPRGAEFFAPPELLEEEEEREELSPAEEMADAVWFDAPDGRQLLVELSTRCEAQWRYSAADQEEMGHFREMIKELQEVRQVERAQHQAALHRLAEATRAFNEKTSPMETAKFELQSQIEVISGEVSEAYSQKFPLQDTLEREKRELEQMEEGLVQEKLGAQRLQSALRMRHHELAEKLQELRATLESHEAAVEGLEADNERCRRYLHAIRFETETERFVPKAIQSRLSVEPSGAK